MGIYNQSQTEQILALKQAFLDIQRLNYIIYISIDIKYDFSVNDTTEEQ